MNRIPNRRERRTAMKFQGMLKNKSKISYSNRLKFIRESIKNGNEIFSANQDAMEKSVAEQLETKELAMIENWKEFGYNSNEIEKLREAYSIITVKDLTTWHTDKKVARNLVKEANKSRIERIHG